MFDARKTRFIRILLLSLLAATTMTITGCARSSRPPDPLTMEEVKAELAKIPQPVGELFLALAAKQSDITDYGKDWQDNVARDPELVARTVRGEARSADRVVTFAQGCGPEDVVAYTSIMSWSKLTGGLRGVHETATWTLYLDRDDRVIGYSELDYRKLK